MEQAARQVRDLERLRPFTKILPAQTFAMLHSHRHTNAASPESCPLARLREASGRGKIAWLPWDLGGLYYRTSLPAHAGLFRDVVNRLNPTRQIVTNSHPLVEISWMKQGNRRLLHLINLSGHFETGYFPPVKMTGLQFEVAGEFKTARTIRSPHQISITTHGGRAKFTVPELDDYELVVLE